MSITVQKIYILNCAAYQVLSKLKQWVSFNIRYDISFNAIDNVYVLLGSAQDVFGRFSKDT